MLHGPGSLSTLTTTVPDVADVTPLPGSRNDPPLITTVSAQKGPQILKPKPAVTDNHTANNGGPSMKTGGRPRRASAQLCMLTDNPWRVSACLSTTIRHDHSFCLVSDLPKGNTTEWLGGLVLDFLCGGLKEDQELGV